MTKTDALSPSARGQKLIAIDGPPSAEKAKGTESMPPELPKATAFEAQAEAPSLGDVAARRKEAVKKQRQKDVAPIEKIERLPEGIKAIRIATPADAEGIAEIQGRLQLKKLDASDHPENGWLLQLSTPEQIRFSMAKYKDYWVAEGDDGRILAYQTISHARFISRPAEKHRFFGPEADRAYDLVQSAEFIYASQIAIAPEGRGKGWGSCVQTKALEHYRDLPLVAHVGVFTQDDLVGWNGDPATLVAHKNNVASHRFHQKHGYVPVAWTSDLPIDAYNSGLAANADKSGVLGIMYVHFRDGRVGTPETYVDPVAAVIASPMSPEEKDHTPWRNPFPGSWPDREYDLSFDEGMFVPNPVLLGRYFEEKNAGELWGLRRASQR